MSDPQNSTTQGPDRTSGWIRSTLSDVFDRFLRMGPTSRNSGLLTVAVLAVALVSTALIPAAPQTAAAQTFGTFNFKGAGWGHGVGMSQYAARNMAADGFSAATILEQYYAGATLSTVAAPEGLRVHLGDAAAVRIATYGSISVENSAGPIASYGPNVDLTMSVSGEGIQFGELWIPVTPLDPAIVSFDSPIRVSTTSDTYLWGKLQLTVRNGKIRVVESDLDMEQYLKGIAEMPSSWPEEALRAQAIAARTYAHYVTADRRSDPEWEREYDLSASTLDQNYEGYGAAVPAWVAAAESTAGQELLFDGQPIKAYYSASNGGFTEKASYVFGFDLPYTVVSEDRYDAYKNPWFEWTRSYGADELSRWLARVPETNVGLVQDVTIWTEGSGGSGRIDQAKVEIVGTNGTKVVNGRRFMVVLNGGLFSEGGGLDRHLPGTFTTISGQLPRPDSVLELTGSRTAPEAVAADTPAAQTPAEVTLAEPVTSTPADDAPAISETSSGPPPAAGTNAGPVTISDVAGDQQAQGELDLLQLDAEGRVVATGWAIDPDASSEALVVDLWIDGRLGAEGLADFAHPTLGDRLSGADSDHGFSLVAPLTEPGHRQVCVVAREYGAGIGISLGCRWFNVTTDGQGLGGAVVSAISSDS